MFSYCLRHQKVGQNKRQTSRRKPSAIVSCRTNVLQSTRSGPSFYLSVSFGGKYSSL